MVKIDKFRTSECEHCNGTGKQFDHAAIGKLLRQMRELQGVRLHQIAERLEVSVPYVSHLECGRRNWTLDRIRKYREALNEAA